jgi:uncharacterized membrane protein YfcA
MSFWWALVAFCAFGIGVTKSGFGSGMGLALVPTLAIALGHTDRGTEAALGFMAQLLVLGDLIAIYQWRDKLSGAVVKRLLPGTFMGVVLGSTILWAFEHYKRDPLILRSLLQIEIGFECMLLVGLHWWRQYRGMQTRLLPEPTRSHLTGSFAGTSSTLCHGAGPIISTYLLPLKLDRAAFVGNSALYFFILNSAKLPFYYLLGQFHHASLGLTAQFMPLVLIGAFVGVWMNRRINDKLFTRIIYIVTFLLGVYILVEGAWNLSHRHPT